MIISQADGIGTGDTWIGMEILSGNLMTGLVTTPLGRFIPQPLESQSLIIDNQWHHVGFVWDGSYRSLFVDGTEVARDAEVLSPLKYSNGGLYIVHRPVGHKQDVANQEDQSNQSQHDDFSNR